MAADDDPEQRIRDLERSLADGVSELGVSSAESGPMQYGYVDAPAPTYIPPRDAYPPPPPPPPGAYGMGYPPPPPPGTYSNPSVTFGTPLERSSSGAFRFVWLIFLIPIIGIVIAVFSFFKAADGVTSQFSSMQSANPSIEFPAPTRGGSPLTVAEGGTVSLSGVSKRETVACDGGSVNVSGVSNTVEITGHCANVLVSGVENNVKVESADSITASGITNRVIFTAGTPETSAIGDNVIEKG